jgi:hypothetical protein
VFPHLLRTVPSIACCYNLPAAKADLFTDLSGKFIHENGKTTVLGISDNKRKPGTIPTNTFHLAKRNEHIQEVATKHSRNPWIRMSALYLRKSARKGYWFNIPGRVWAFRFRFWM